MVIVRVLVFKTLRLKGVLRRCPKLCALLLDQKVQVEAVEWDGKIESIPTDGQIMVHCCREMFCRTGELARFCATCGYIPFYDDFYLSSDGVFFSGLEERIIRWLKLVAR